MTPRGDEGSATGSWRGRLPGIALYFVLGVLVGVMGSFTHRARFELFGVPIWYGIVVAVLCVLAFAVGLRFTSRDRLVGIGFAVGVSIGVVAIAAGFDHSVVVLGDLVGTAWLALSILSPYLAALWPRIPSRRPRATGAPVASAADPDAPGAPDAPGRPQARGYAGSQAPGRIDPAADTPVSPKEPPQ